MDIVKVDRLAKSFGPTQAVKGVSFAVEQGEIFGFLGPNGAGKTTTINMLCTLLAPSSGRAEVAGFDIVRQRSQVRRNIGLVFQEPTLDEYLTAEQNLRFHAYAYGVPEDKREKRLRELLELVELESRRRDRVRDFSGGMKRRLELARGLLHDPKILFLDEPTLGLDPQTRRRIWDYVLELRAKEKLTIFLTTHYMDEAENCDRVAIIDRGQIVRLGSPESLKDALGGDLVTIKAADNSAAAMELKEKFGLAPELNDGLVSFAVAHGDEFLPEFIKSFSQPLESVNLRRPTLEDVFLTVTGHAIREEEPEAMGRRMLMRRR